MLGYGRKMARVTVAALAGALLVLGIAAGPASAASAISVTDVAFGSVNVGSSSTQTVTVSNSGDASFTVSSIILGNNAPGAFSIPAANDSCTGATVAAGGHCTFKVAFAPPNRGLFSAMATIGSDAADSSDNVSSLSGSGVAPAVTFTPDAISFGEQIRGTTSAAETLKIENTGDATLQFTVTKTGANPGDFAIENNGCLGFPKSLAPGASCLLDVRFTPAADGARTAAIRVTSNAPPSGQDDLQLGGTGTSPLLGLEPAALSFGDQLVGSPSAARTLTIRNAGTGTLVLGSIAVTGSDYSVDDSDCLPFPRLLSAGQSCSVRVTFLPGGAGARSGGVHVETNAGGGDATLSGNGTQPATTTGTSGADTSQPGTAPPTSTEVIAQTVAPPPTRCRVPRLTGKTLSAARRALRAAGCALGKVRKARSSKPAGRVMRQGLRAGRRVPRGTKVALVLSRR
jgi:hypothetical protein